MTRGKDTHYVILEFSNPEATWVSNSYMVHGDEARDKAIEKLKRKIICHLVVPILKKDLNNSIAESRKNFFTILQTTLENTIVNPQVKNITSFLSDLRYFVSLYDNVKREFIHCEKINCKNCTWKNNSVTSSMCVEMLEKTGKIPVNSWNRNYVINNIQNTGCTLSAINSMMLQFKINRT